MPVEAEMGHRLETLSPTLALHASLAFVLRRFNVERRSLPQRKEAEGWEGTVDVTARQTTDHFP